MPKDRIIALHIYSDEIMRVVIDGVKKRGWVPLDVTTTGSGLLSFIRPDIAVVFVRDADDSNETWRALRSANCPIILVGWGYGHSEKPWPIILNDDFISGRLAAEHFVERGFNTLGYVGNRPWGKCRQLYEAFAKRAAELGATCRLLQFEAPGASSTRELKHSNYLQFKAWLESGPTPLGLLSWGVRGGTRLWELCHQHGFSVPDDVAILVAGDDSPRCECAPVPLSCIGVDRLGIANATVELIEDILAGHPRPRSRY